MPDEEQLELLRQGVQGWNEWRRNNPRVRPSLSRANLSNANLRGANLSKANLRKANLRKADLQAADLHDADLMEASLRKANLRGARASGACLRRANMTRASAAGADLTAANLHRANLRLTDLTEAVLPEADLSEANLMETTVEGATLRGSWVYGASVWNLRGQPKDESDLNVSGPDKAINTAPSLEAAQFIHLLLNNEKVPKLLGAATSKVVLILGSFTEERKAVLDTLRDELRERDYSPILFDFDIPQDRDITETVALLARMARFVIADLTDPKSIPQELQAFVPDVAVPVQPIIHESQDPWSMFPDLKKYPWMLQPHPYSDQQQLLAAVSAVIAPAEDKRIELGDG